MTQEYTTENHTWFVMATLLIYLFVKCAEPPESCPPTSPVDLSQMQTYFENENLPFQFPLKDSRIFQSQTPFLTKFATYGRTRRGSEYHAAEDFLQPAGTPVYAMANGHVRFSGPMKGYGWLIIIDHPQPNIYSLYGHLSPSRWEIEKGPVQKGELIGYLGDSDENGGNEKYPLRTHLHFGVRVGQRADYPGMGQWRWQAGWIKPCPQDLGWLQPVLVIISQDIHFGERYKPSASFLTRWWLDILFTGIYILGGICMLIVAEKHKKPVILIVSCIVLFITGWIFMRKGMIMSYLLFFMAGLLFLIGVIRAFRYWDNIKNRYYKKI